MCGRLNIIDDPFVIALLQELHVKPIAPLNTGKLIRPTETISIIREQNSERTLEDAIWWLLLENNEAGLLKPSRFTSFNTRSDKLLQPNTAGYHAFKHQRCIIVASGFGETLNQTLDNGKRTKRFFNFYPIDNALVFAGLYRQWLDQKTGKPMLSTSIITKPPHPKMMLFHTKASPFILNQTDNSISRWLDPQTDLTELTPLLEPFIPQDLSVAEIAKPNNLTPIDEAQLLVRDMVV
ncbi:SOS response-associated peptidase family protein [Thalassotalea ganghwensis]